MDTTANPPVEKPIFDFTPPPEAPAEIKQEAEPKPEAQSEAAKVSDVPPPVEPKPEQPKVDTVPFNKFEREKQRRREAEDRARQLALEAERYKGMVEGMKKPEPVQAQETKAPAVSTPPKLEDFPDWDSYDTAKTEYIAGKKLEAYQAQVREEMEKEASERTEAAKKRSEVENHQRYIQTVHEKVRQAGESNPDYAAVVQGEASAHFSDTVLKMMVDSDKFADMTYYLASNTDKLDRLVMLANVNPVAAAREVGNLEAAFKYGPHAVKRVSTAPPPVVPLTPAPGKMEREETAAEYIYRKNREADELRRSRQK